MEKLTPASDVERRKQVRIRIRTDLQIAPQKYEGKTYYVVKDPVSLRYYRFEEQEHFIIGKMNGAATLDETQKEFEKRFRPKRLTLEDLEAFAQQLLTAGLAHNESPQAGPQLFQRRKKRRRSEWLQLLTNILYIKIPIYDPDRLLNWMIRYTRWIFTGWFFAINAVLWVSAALLVATHFEQFYDKLPDSRVFFQFGTVVHLWIALGLVKIIHEFGHGLSCKAFGGEVHEMGALFLCLSPCLYCNVSDAWTMPSKWRRIIISWAGIHVELVIAAISTWVWWNTKHGEFWNEMCLSLMVVCSVSTFLFNANPLMRFDGYYVLADWLEIPNLRDRSNRFLKQLVQEHCLGVEVQPEPYMTLGRRVLFVVYAVASYIYRWVITFSILVFLYNFLKPYKLGAISALLAIAAGGSMIGWPLYRMGKAIHKRGRLPDMKSRRVTISAAIVAGLILFFLFVPLPVSRVRQTALVQLQPEAIEKVYAPLIPGSIGQGVILDKLGVRDGEWVEKGTILGQFTSLELRSQWDDANAQVARAQVQIRAFLEQKSEVGDPQELNKIEQGIISAQSEMKSSMNQVEMLKRALDRLVLRAPRSGMVMSSPKIDEVGKMWDKEQAIPFCSIGDPSRLMVLMPVPPEDYRLLQEDLKYDKDLAVTIRVQGRAEYTWEGTNIRLQDEAAKEIPIQLSTKFGGPLPPQPSAQPSNTTFVPQSQQYLVFINFKEPDDCIHPGTLAQVKVHCRWKSSWWWVKRKVFSMFHVGLI